MNGFSLNFICLLLNLGNCGFKVSSLLISDNSFMGLLFFYGEESWLKLTLIRLPALNFFPLLGVHSELAVVTTCLSLSSRERAIRLIFFLTNILLVYCYFCCVSVFYLIRALLAFIIASNLSCSSSELSISMSPELSSSSPRAISSSVTLLMIFYFLV